MCEEHGGQGIVLTCPHVWQDIQSGTATIDCMVTTTDEISSLVDQIITIRLGCCAACAKQYEADLPGELDDQTKPVCGKCFEVFQETLRR